MSYSEFTFQRLRDTLALHLMQDASLFAHVEEVAVSEYLQTTLQENIALALNINTEKARPEMIIAPMLIEIRKILKKTGESLYVFVSRQPGSLSGTLAPFSHTRIICLTRDTLLPQ